MYAEIEKPDGFDDAMEPEDAWYENLDVLLDEENDLYGDDTEEDWIPDAEKAKGRRKRSDRISFRPTRSWETRQMIRKSPSHLPQRKNQVLTRKKRKKSLPPWEARKNRKPRRPARWAFWEILHSARFPETIRSPFVIWRTSCVCGVFRFPSILPTVWETW